MARLTPQEAADKWAQRTAAATADVARGIDRVTTAPGQKAAQASGKWLAKVSQAEQKFADRSRSVPLQDWQAAAKLGTQRIAAGVQAKKGKMEAFQSEFSQHLDRGKAAIDSMDTSTLEGAIAKATAQMRHNATFRRSGR